MDAVSGLAREVGVEAACAALGVPRATWYRHQQPRRPQPPRKKSPRALSESEAAMVLAVLTEERFVDRAPEEVYATLLDEGVYLCSPRTMYRILKANKAIQERRRQRRHPKYKKPELVAEAPNEVWSWDITKLRGPTKGTYYYLYVLMDIFSRLVVGWMLADRENANLAGQLIVESCARHGVRPGTLKIHSDRGAPMTAKCTAQLLADLGVTRSLSRPHVSDDNPFSEAQFKTLKYAPAFPGRFGGYEQARSFCRPLSANVVETLTSPAITEQGERGRGDVEGQEGSDVEEHRAGRGPGGGGEADAPEVHGEVQAADHRGGRRLHRAGRGRASAASGGAVHLPLGGLAQGEAPGRVDRSGAEEARSQAASA